MRFVTIGHIVQHRGASRLFDTAAMRLLPTEVSILRLGAVENIRRENGELDKIERELFGGIE